MLPILLDNLMSQVGGLGASKPGTGFTSLRDKYDGFSLPRASVEVNGQPFSDKNNLSIISNVTVELSCGYEASVASFRIYNAYDTSSATFRFKDLKQMLLLGTQLKISLGYADTVSLIFVGFIAEVHFGMDEGDTPYIEVMGMDAKGIMMAGCYSTQLKARSFGEAIREVLQRAPYQKLSSDGIIAATEVADTPDKTAGSLSPGEGKASSTRVEMVAESDYEFIVKAAKKFNYEFFVEKGKVLFRKAKTGASNIVSLGIGAGVSSFEIGYGITGLVETVEARSMDAGNGKLITSKKKLTANLSSAGKAKGLISKSSRIYIDPTITSREQADARVDSILEEMRFRLGSLHCQCVGLPELLPGHFIDVEGVGAPVANTFYITQVTHELDENRGYFTRLVGKAAEVKK